MALQWEQVAFGKVSRSKIPGGWLLARGTGESSALLFVDDPNHQWEDNWEVFYEGKLFSFHLPRLHRSKVPKGWLIMKDRGGTVAFVPDPNHEWDGSSLP
jgi:hypothetical protein